jgi:hypothetical protein
LLGARLLSSDELGAAAGLSLGLTKGRLNIGPAIAQ